MRSISLLKLIEIGNVTTIELPCKIYGALPQNLHFLHRYAQLKFTILTNTNEKCAFCIIN